VSNPFVGEIRWFAGNFAPLNWALCDGQVMSIEENTTLFSLIGTTYGGDGVNTFNLPDLRSRVPMHMGGGALIGEQAGSESVTLNTQQIPLHSHGVQASASAGTIPGPGGNMLAASDSIELYSAGAPNEGLNADAIAPGGGSQPHDNRQPYVALTPIISLFGIYPSQN
jgi:microcystin-dependent protein